MPEFITADDIRQEYHAALTYVRANLANRDKRPESCLNDEQIVTYIDFILTPEGITQAINAAHTVRKAREEHQNVDS